MLLAAFTCHSGEDITDQTTAKVLLSIGTYVRMEMLIPMELRQLKYFVAAAETGNISRAAQRLNISQPPVSRQIRSLEHELGFDLFLRTVRGVELTAAGKHFFIDAQRILTDAEVAKRSALAANLGEVGTLEVAFFGSVIYRAVPLALAALKKQQPGVLVSISRRSKAEQQEALKSGAIHLGFGRYYDGDPSFKLLTLAQEPVLLAVSVKEGLVPGTPLSVEEAIARPISLFPAKGRPNFADHLITSLTAAGLSPRIAHESEDATTALVRTVDGDCRAFVPASAAVVQFEGVGFHPIHDLVLRAPLNCIYSAEHNSPILNLFLDTLSKADFSKLSV